MSIKKPIWGCPVIWGWERHLEKQSNGLHKYINNWYSSHPYCGSSTRLPPAALAPSHLILITTLEMVISYAHFIEQKAEA